MAAAVASRTYTVAQKWIPMGALLLIVPFSVTFEGGLRATLVYLALMLFLHMIEAGKRAQLTDPWWQMLSVSENDARRIAPFMLVCSVPLPWFYLPGWVASWIIPATLVAAFAAFRPNQEDQRSYAAGLRGVVAATQTGVRPARPRGAISKEN